VQQVESLMTSGSWGADGVKPLTMIVFGEAANQPATTSDAYAWITRNVVKSATVVADPSFTFNMSSVPVNVLVDPRTMKIVNMKSGCASLDADVDTLALANKGH
jgi:hypothetical protein